MQNCHVNHEIHWDSRVLSSDKPNENSTRSFCRFLNRLNAGLGKLLEKMEGRPGQRFAPMNQWSRYGPRHQGQSSGFSSFGAWCRRRPLESTWSKNHLKLTTQSSVSIRFPLFCCMFFPKATNSNVFNVIILMFFLGFLRLHFESDRDPRGLFILFEM